MLLLQKNSVIHPVVALVMRTTCICWKIGCPAAELIFMHRAGRKPGAIAPTANQYRAILYDYIRAELFAYAMFFTILVDFHHYVSVYIHPCIIILHMMQECLPQNT